MTLLHTLQGQYGGDDSGRQLQGAGSISQYWGSKFATRHTHTEAVLPFSSQFTSSKNCPHLGFLETGGCPHPWGWGSWDPLSIFGIKKFLALCAEKKAEMVKTPPPARCPWGGGVQWATLPIPPGPKCKKKIKKIKYPWSTQRRDGEQVQALCVARHLLGQSFLASQTPGPRWIMEVACGSEVGGGS